MGKKGVSLALETVIVLILAITVLTVLTFFFNKQFGESSSTIDLLNGQRDACAAYVRQDSRCSQEGYSKVSSLSTKEFKDILLKISYYCGKQQGYRYCSCTSSDWANCKAASKECVFECCQLVCPAGTKPK